MANTVANVTAAKPAVGGAVSMAALGSTLPTDATTALDAAFTSLGYLSEDGYTNNHTPTVESVKAFGGDVVLNAQTERVDEFSFTLIEALNIDVLKLVYGDSAVTGTLSTGMTVNANATDLTSHAFVIQTILKGNVTKRTVIPNAKVTSVGEIAYKDGEAVGYAITLTASPDASGNTHYEYIKTASST